MSNPCVLCGKQRVDGKSWKGKIGASVVTYTNTVCPDSKCQKLVDEAISQRKAKTALLAEEKVKAKIAREKLMASTS